MITNRFMRGLLACTVFVLAFNSVWAQSIPLPSTNLSGSISATNTFQLIQGQTNNRNGCLIQNNGTHNMNVYFGATANATTSNSFILAPAQPISCAIGSNLVVKDAISITGTSGDSFSANFQ
jgi:hypothetical protein